MPPAFWILDGCAITGRDGLYGIATTTTPTWWKNDFGRHYSGRHGGWSRVDIVGDAPVSLDYRGPGDDSTRGWYLLCARGRVAYITSANMLYHQLDVRGPMRRLRLVEDGLVAVGAHGQIYTGTFDKPRRIDALYQAEGPRFFVDVAGTTLSDFTVVGRGGEVFHWDGKTFTAWPTGTGDLHVIAHGKQLAVGGDDGVVLVRSGTAWKRVTVPTTDPIVGLAWLGDRLWASTPTHLFSGTATKLTAVKGLGFGGQLGVGDGALHCFGVAELARLEGKTWKLIPHPDQPVQVVPPLWPSLGDSLDAAIKPIVHPAKELGGTLFTADDLKKKDLARWSKLAKTPKDVTTMLAEPGMYSVLEIDGDLHVKGDLSTFKRELVGLVVHGDLIVDGTFSDNDHPATLTLVKGSLRAKTIITSGQLEVRGSVRCEHLIGDNNDYGATFSGDVTAKLFWPENHHFELTKPPKLDLVVGYGAEHRVPAKLRKHVTESPAKTLKAKLRAELMNEDEPDRKRVLAALRAGESIWKTKR